VNTTCACDDAHGAFAVAGDRWQFAGRLTFDDAAAILAAADAMPLPVSGVIDLSGLAHADSAALAVLLALRRRAAAERRDIVFAAMPPAVASLARVYGIEDLLAAQA
jgi:phospholipid transport system transporter-binding protein